MDDITNNAILDLDGVNVGRTALLSSIAVGCVAAGMTWIVSRSICLKTFSDIKVFTDEAHKIVKI